MILRSFLVFTFIFSLGFPAAAFAAETLPPGVIAMSGTSRMTWADAKNFCEQKGGRLPLIDGKKSLDRISKGTPIDFFGVTGAPWPADMGRFTYWTGTESTHPDSKGEVWRAIPTGDRLLGGNTRAQDDTNRVLCVPK